MIDSQRREPPPAPTARPAGRASPKAKRDPGRSRVSSAEKEASKRKREQLAQTAADKEHQRLHHNLQVHVNKGRRAVEPTPTNVAPTQDDGWEPGRVDSATARTLGPTALQQASQNALAMFSPQNSIALQEEVSRQEGEAGQEVDQEAFLRTLGLQ